MEEENYKFPQYELLIKNDKKGEIDYSIEKKKIEKFFRSYNIDIECKEVYNNMNSITYIIDLKQKVRVKTITNYKDDILLYFNAIDVEFIIAINGTSYLGIQVINTKNNTITLGDIIDSDKFKKNDYKIPLIIGKDFNNNNIIEDLAVLPHLLIAGTTGTGKSNFLSTFVIDIIYKLGPEKIKLVLVDTRKTSFTKFNGISHLLLPVITESKKALGMIAVLIQEMNNRYVLFNKENVDNIDSYNEISVEKLPRIVVIIEDFCDLMIDTENEIEEYIKRLIQMSRASGIHIIISTQRPSTNVITGLIKANIPARIAFKVPSQIDSKTIIDVSGAEELLMYGDVLFTKVGEYKPIRIQTPYISDKEIDDIMDFIKTNNNQQFNIDIIEEVEKNNKKFNQDYDFEYEEDETDPFLLEAIECAIEEGEVTTSFIQRRFKVGYARAGRIIDQMEELGIISGYLGSKPRKVLITLEELKKLKG